MIVYSSPSKLSSESIKRNTGAAWVTLAAATANARTMSAQHVKEHDEDKFFSRKNVFLLFFETLYVVHKSW